VYCKDKQKLEIMKEKENVFEKNGYIDVPYKRFVTSAHVREMLALWKDFCLLGLYQKQRHIMTHEGGYEYKDQASRDYKENFHFSLAYTIDIEKEKIEERSFLIYAKFFLEKLIPLVRSIGTQIEWVGEADMSKLMVKDPSRWTLRFLHYPPWDQPLDLIRADPHPDKYFTIHITETAPGLQVLWKGKWHNVATQKGHFLAYAGLNGQYYSNCKVPALCHQVVNSEKTRKKGRFAIILFVPFGKVEYDKATFGSAQDQFPNGENYGMSFAKFSRFFVEAEKEIL
jgi:isopenicillin N synthase-like dioxygenase